MVRSTRSAIIIVVEKPWGNSGLFLMPGPSTNQMASADIVGDVSTPTIIPTYLLFTLFCPVSMLREKIDKT